MEDEFGYLGMGVILPEIRVLQPKVVIINRSLSEEADEDGNFMNTEQGVILCKIDAI